MATKTTTFRSGDRENLEIIFVPAKSEARNSANQVISPGQQREAVQFEAGVLEVSDAKTVKRLRDHPMFNSPVGFYEDGNAPDEPKPTRDTQNKAINRLLRDEDVLGLKDLLAEEQATHNRPEIVSRIADALSLLTVPGAEEHGAIGRADEPAEKEAGLPRVDPPDATQGRVEPEVARERMLKSADLAQKRAEAVGHGETVPEKVDSAIDRVIDEEVETQLASPREPGVDDEQLAEKVAGAGSSEAPAPKATAPKSSAPKKEKEKAEAIDESIVPADPAAAAEEEAAAEEPDTGSGPYANRTLAQLQAVAAQQDLEGRSGMNKKQLVAALQGKTSGSNAGARES